MVKILTALELIKVLNYNGKYDKKVKYIQLNLFHLLQVHKSTSTWRKENSFKSLLSTFYVILHDHNVLQQKAYIAFQKIV